MRRARNKIDNISFSNLVVTPSECDHVTLAFRPTVSRNSYTVWVMVSIRRQTTSSSSVAKRPRDASCMLVVSFNSTKRRAAILLVKQATDLGR